jgi:hypothetical protein
MIKAINSPPIREAFCIRGKNRYCPAAAVPQGREKEPKEITHSNSRNTHPAPKGRRYLFFGKILKSKKHIASIREW